MIVYKIFLNKQLGFIVSQCDLSCVLNEIENLELGDILSIAPMEMSEKAYKKLPEFSGW